MVLSTRTGSVSAGLPACCSIRAFIRMSRRIESDEHLAILSPVILHAKSMGLDFGIYDENGRPNGTVGGELPKHHRGPPSHPPMTHVRVWHFRLFQLPPEHIS